MLSAVSNLGINKGSESHKNNLEEHGYYLLNACHTQVLFEAHYPTLLANPYAAL